MLVLEVSLLLLFFGSIIAFVVGMVWLLLCVVKKKNVFRPVVLMLCSLVMFILVCVVIVAAVPEQHDWKDATCTEPKTCLHCGATEGEAMGHDWKDATCTEPKTCLRCGATEGEAMGHDWKDVTCTEPKTCLRCGATEGEAMGHDWKNATCTEPKTCLRCGATEGEALGHDAPNLSCTESALCTRCGEELPALGHDWKDATCTEPKTCSRCGATEGEALGHDAGEPVRENVKEATCTENGNYDEVVYCSRCQEEISRVSNTEDALGHTTSNGVCSRCGVEIYETVTGRGDDVLTEISVGDGLYKVHFTNNGRSNFSVWVYDKDGDRDLAVNEIGNYDGYYFLTGSSPYMFEIGSNGNWSYTIERVGVTTATSFEGHGCYVTDMFPASSGKWHITHNGNSNFVVFLYTTSGRDLLVNEIGAYDGNKLFSIPAGSNALLVIEADGDWAITPAN